MVPEVPKGIPGLFSDRDAMDKENLRKKTIQFSARMEQNADSEEEKLEEERCETDTATSTVNISNITCTVPHLSQTPRWISHDKVILRFNGYFTERIDFNEKSEYRKRFIHICYYTSDETIQIYEPKIKNSGLIQGPFLRRTPMKQLCLTLDDMRVGANIQLLGRDILLYECDERTRTICLREFQICQKKNLEVSIPSKENKEYAVPGRAGLTLAQETQLLNKQRFNGNFYGNLRNYLRYGERTLKFLVSWVESQECSEKRYFTILYHLCDDTLEIREKQKVSKEKSVYSQFLKRSKPINSENKNFFHWKEFKTGELIKINERKYFIISCDEDTEAFYRSQGIEQTCIMADFTAYKNYFDSASTTSIVKASVERERIQSQKRAYRKQKKFGDQHLKMRIRLLNEDNWIREFVLSFYLADENLSIYEPPNAKTETPGGRFLEKNKYINNRTRKSFIATDFKHILQEEKPTFEVLSRTYEVIYVDKFTKRFLDVEFKNRLGGEKSKLTVLAKKVRAFMLSTKHDFRRVFFETDKINQKFLTKQKTKYCLGFLRSQGLRLSQNECDWLVKKYCAHGRFYYLELCTELTNEINSLSTNTTKTSSQFNLEDLERMLNTKLQNEGQSVRNLFRKFDVDRSGTLTFTEFQELLKHFNIFLTIEQVSYIMSKYDKDQQGTIDYNEFYDRIARLQHTNNNDINRRLESLSLNDFNIWEEGKDENSMENSYLNTVQSKENRYNIESHVANTIKRFVILCSSRRTQFRQIFRHIDDSKDGKVSREELQQALSLFSEFSDKDKAIILDHFYKTEQEELSYEQFMDIIATVNT